MKRVIAVVESETIDCGDLTCDPCEYSEDGFCCKTGEVCVEVDGRFQRHESCVAWEKVAKDNGLGRSGE